MLNVIIAALICFVGICIGLLVYDAITAKARQEIEECWAAARRAHEAAERRLEEISNNPTGNVLYICDGRQCGDVCPNPFCELTNDIRHARNFEYKHGFWVEKLEQ